MAGLLNACVHSGLFLVVSGRLRVLQLTVSSRFWDKFFRSKGTDVAQRRMWNGMMDHCLGLGSGCVSLCVCECVYAYVFPCQFMQWKIKDSGLAPQYVHTCVQSHICMEAANTCASVHIHVYACMCTHLLKYN